MKRIRHFLRSEDGAGMVEFAIASLVLMSMIFFVLEFGQATWRYNTIASLAKDGARWASLHGTNGVTTADSAAVQDYVNGRSQGIVVIVRTSWPDGGSKASGSRVQVTVEGNFTPRVSIIPHSALNFHSTAQVIIAR
jgi:Flp pilus assembly protein TadG